MTKLTTEQRIAALEAKIDAIKQRAERKKVRAKPEVKFLGMALRSLDKALNATEDAVIRKPLDEARTTVASCLALCGIKPRVGRRTLTPKPRQQLAATVDADEVWSYVRKNPGQKSEEIAVQFGTDTATLRPLFKGLIAAGQVRVEGERRAMLLDKNLR